MKAELVDVHVVGLRWMELQDCLLWLPEQRLHKAHVVPGWTPVLDRHRDMLPSATTLETTGDHPQCVLSTHVRTIYLEVPTRIPELSIRIHRVGFPELVHNDVRLLSHRDSSNGI